jgi:hypothetical protein
MRTSAASRSWALLRVKATGTANRTSTGSPCSHAWEMAGLAPESILMAVRQGELSFSFLETPGWVLPGRPDATYRELTEQQGVPLSLILGLHVAIGFQAPGPDERVRQDDLVMVELARTFLEAGASQAAVRRVFHLYADNLRRLATAEAELYQEVMRPAME